jgi:hypothetical protein
MASTPISGDTDKVLVDSLTTTTAEALAQWIAQHDRNLTTIDIAIGHFDHFYRLILARRFPDARVIATFRTVEFDGRQRSARPVFQQWWPGQLLDDRQTATSSHCMRPRSTRRFR